MRREGTICRVTHIGVALDLIHDILGKASMIVPFQVADRMVGLDPIAIWLRVQTHPIALVLQALRPGGMLDCC